MNKIFLIIQREYLTRVKKKSFLIMTIVGPLLMAGIMIVPAWLAMKDKDLQIIEVIDETGKFVNQFENTSELLFRYEFRNIDTAKQEFYNEKYTSILYITSAQKKSVVEMFYKKQPGISTIKHIELSLEKAIKNIELNNKFHISKDQLAEIQPDVQIKTIYRDINGDEESKNSVIITIVGFVGAISIYMFIFLYGVQIMRGVIEEKTSRIVEIIISSVKPFQLMMGKIFGIALVGLTQFLLWIVLTTSIYGGFQSFFSQNVKNDTRVEAFVGDQNEMNINPDQVMEKMNALIDDIPISKIIVSFLFYFLGGYLLYGAFFAAVGSAVDNEADTQQFMMPITVPLLFGILVAQNVMENPDGAMAFWLSMVPFTSPIIMMVRIPFGVETWELLLSMSLLILGFIGSTWLAARIYKTGILMYGKKVNYKEIGKWLFYKG